MTVPARCDYEPCQHGWVEYVLKRTDGVIVGREVAECPYLVLHEEAKRS